MDLLLLPVSRIYKAAEDKENNSVQFLAVELYIS